MMCCAIAALIVAGVAALRGVVTSVWTRLPQARWMFVSLAVAAMLAGGSALAARQFDPASQRTDLAALLMQHICGINSVARPHAP